MSHFIQESAVLLLSSMVPLAIGYLQVSTAIVQQVLAVLLAVLLIFLNKSILSSQKPIPYVLQLLLIFLIAILLQLLIFSTGGFSSPFLILFHLFALGLSFLLTLKIATVFLGFAGATLLFNTLFLDQKLLALFTTDPWPTVLYIISFMAIIPLYHLVMSRYNLKDAMARLLTSQLKLTTTQLRVADTQLKLTKKREESLLGGLSDLVIVTDTNLNILSFNESVIQTLHLLPSELLHRPLFDLLYLRTSSGEVMDRQTLSVDEAKSGANTSFSDLLLYTKDSAFPQKARVQIFPVSNLKKEIDQLVFIITCFSRQIGGDSFHQTTKEAIIKYESLVANLKEDLRLRGLSDLVFKMELLKKMEKDILVVSEIEDHGVAPSLNFIDIAELVYLVIEREKNFAANLRVSLKLEFDEKFQQMYPSVQSVTSEEFPRLITSRYFTIPSDPKWLNLLVEKMIEISLFLGFRKQGAFTRVVLACDDGAVYVSLESLCPQLPPDYQNFFTKNFPALASVEGLKWSSGLERYLVKTLATLLGFPVDIKYYPEKSTLAFSLIISKKGVVS